MQSKIKSNTQEKKAKRFFSVPNSLSVSGWDDSFPIKKEKISKTKQEVCDCSDLHLAYAFPCCEVRVNMYPYSLTASGSRFARVSIDTQQKAAARQSDGPADLHLQQVGDDG